MASASRRAAEWGFDFDDLAAAGTRGPVYCEATGWAGKGPATSDFAQDFSVQAFAGVAHGLRPVDEAPAPSRVLLVDYAGGLVAALGVLMCLNIRDETGQPCRADTSLFGSAIVLEHVVLEGLRAGREDHRRGGRPVWGPLDEPLETADGYLVVSVSSDEVPVLAAALGCQDAVDAPATIAEQLKSGKAHYWEEVVAATTPLPCATVTTDLALLSEDPWVAPALEKVGDGYMPAPPWTFHASL